MKKYLLLAATYLVLFQLRAQNVSFSVDMNAYTDDFSSVHIVGEFNDWNPAVHTLSDDDGDGIYEILIEALPLGVNRYKFTLDAWNNPESFTGEEPCADANDFGVDRTINVLDDMEVCFIWNACETCATDSTNQFKNVKFAVDMNAYTDDFSSVHIVGEFNDWNPAVHTLSDDDGDGIYEILIEVPLGINRYKFTLDEWNNPESFTGEEPCADANNFGVDRIINVLDDMELCFRWNACETCDEDPIEEFSTINFSVDMNNYAGAFSSVHVVGIFNDWTPTELTDTDGDGIYETSISGIPNGFYIYKFILDDWAVQEVLSANELCSEGVDRKIQVNGNANVCYNWNSCTTCYARVTLHVDLSNYTESFETVTVLGNYDGWTSNVLLEDADGDKIYTKLLILPYGTHQYKFALDRNPPQSPGIEESFIGTESCAIGADRQLVVDGEMERCYVWNSCMTCDLVSVQNLAVPDALFKIQPTIVTDQTTLDFKSLDASKTIRILNAIGQQMDLIQVPAHVSQYQLNLSSLTEGLYFVNVQTKGKQQTKRIVISR